MLCHLCTDWMRRTCITSTTFHIWKIIWRGIYTSRKIFVSCIYGYFEVLLLSVFINASLYHILVYANQVCRNWYLTGFGQVVPTSFWWKYGWKVMSIDQICINLCGISIFIWKLVNIGHLVISENFILHNYFVSHFLLFELWNHPWHDAKVDDRNKAMSTHWMVGSSLSVIWIGCFVCLLFRRDRKSVV